LTSFSVAEGLVWHGFGDRKTDIPRKAYPNRVRLAGAGGVGTAAAGIARRPWAIRER